MSVLTNTSLPPSIEAFLHRRRQTGADRFDEIRDDAVDSLAWSCRLRVSGDRHPCSDLVERRVTCSGHRLAGRWLTATLTCMTTPTFGALMDGGREQLP